MVDEQEITLHEMYDATNADTGERGRYYAAEHVNVGPGWMMLPVEGQGGVVASQDLKDVVRIGPWVPKYGTLLRGASSGRLTYSGSQAGEWPEAWSYSTPTPPAPGS